MTLMAQDMYGPMRGASAWMMTSDWDTRHLLLLWTMWAVMMACMMLPTAAPMLFLYAIAMRKQGQGGVIASYLFALGYLAVWAVFSLGATIAQRFLGGWLLLTPMLEPTSVVLPVTLLVLAGVYQLTPIKHACLDSCRSPVAFLTEHWRDGTGGAFRMGLEHGMFCLGCCWALMLLLFAGGVMNLNVILALTLLVLAEKVTPYGPMVGRYAGVGFFGLAVWSVVG
jgi:predicted metal-binding membrane protein